MLKRQAREESSAGVGYVRPGGFQPELRGVYVGIADKCQTACVIQCERAMVWHLNGVMGDGEHCRHRSL
jgi:hypothetical protein